MISISQFDEINGIVGSPFESGYLIKLTDIPSEDSINYLSDQFGEGVISDEFVNGVSINNPNWAFIEFNSESRRKLKREFKIILLKDLSMVEQFTSHFNIEYELDTTQLIENRIFDKICHFLHEPVTIKNRNRIKDIVQKELKTKFKLFITCAGIKISFKQKDNFTKTICYGI